MYKINEAADLLKVTRVEIFEKLLSQRELFNPYIEKINGVTWISDAGIAKLKEMIFEKEISSLEVLDQLAIEHLPGQSLSSEVFDLKSVEEVKQDKNQTGLTMDRQLFKSKFYSGESLKKSKESLIALRQRIRQLRNQILTSDSELKRKEDAIAHYQQILKDDLDWIKNLEQQLAEQILNLDYSFPSAPDFEMPGEEKPGIKKFFKR